MSRGASVPAGEAMVNGTEKAAPDAVGLNSNHRRVLVSTFEHLAELVRQMEVAALVDVTPLARYVADLGVPERRVLLDHLSALRSRLAEGLEHLGMRIPGPRITSSRAIRERVRFAQIALEDLAPAALTGYGALSPAAESAVERVSRDLDATLSRLARTLARGLGVDLAGRLAQVAEGPIDLETVRLLERIVSTHGLVELRPGIEALVESLETGDFEIALLGRVSSGKSSLLNTLLGAEVLPVGVTPVTAVPTRVTWGEQASAVIERAGAPVETVALSRLAEFVSEEENPDNQKRVTRVMARLPSERLVQGVALVDTPGLGALATAGERATRSYLPRADLGILLVDAASSVMQDDVEIVRLLLESGIPAQILISKADLLSPADRDRVVEHARRAMTTSLGMEVPVYLVSAVGDVRALANGWFDSQIVPLLNRARDASAASLGRKLGALCEAAAAALRILSREGGPVDGDERDPTEEQRRVEDLARRVAARVADGERRARAAADGLASAGQAALEEAARELAVGRGLAGQGRPAGDVVRELLLAAARAGAGEVRRELLATRDGVEALIAEMTGRAEGAHQLALDLVGQPRLAEPPELAGFEIRLPRWSRMSKTLAERRAASLLRARLAEPAERALSDLASRLRIWGGAVLARLDAALAGEIEPLRAAARVLRDRPESRARDTRAALADLHELEERSPWLQHTRSAASTTL